MADLLLPVVPGDLTPVELTEGAPPAAEARGPTLSEYEVEAIREVVDASDADNTKRTYRSAWSSFTAFCDARDATPLPATAETLAAYLTLATRQDGKPYTVSTLSLHLAAIKRAHRERGLAAPVEHPLVFRTWKGLRRVRGTQQQGATALTADLLAKLVKALDDDARSVRDKALLLIGFSGAFRRSELVALTVGDVQMYPLGIRLRAVRRKTSDQEVFVDLRRQGGALCPVEALLGWLDVLARDDSQRLDALSPLWRRVPSTWVSNAGLSAGSIREVVRRRSSAAGLDEGTFTAHSLRAGYATSAAEAGQSVIDIREGGGWASVVTVDRYVRHRRQFGEDAPRSQVLADLAQQESS